MSVFNKTSQVPEQPVDRSSEMRIGHPQIKDGDDYITALLHRHFEQRGNELKLLNIGAGSGYYAQQLSRLLPDIEVTVQEDYAPAIEALNNRLAGGPVEIFDRPLEAWSHPVDVVLCWGAHHHLSSGYANYLKNFLSPDGVFIVGDEFCPEYCDGNLAKRIVDADLIHMADGYVLTTEEEVQTFNANGELPPAAKAMEVARQNALWHWYRYVIDVALAHRCLSVVQYELHAVQDDLSTGCGDEHKMSPLIFEKEMQLAGLNQLSRHSVGADCPVNLQSFFVYEYTPHP